MMTKTQLPVNPSKVLANIRNFEKKLMENQMGNLKDLDDSDYLELMEVMDSKEPREELEDIIKSI